MFNEPSEIKIAIIGLGYVGLPLAVEFSKKFNVVGFDTSSQRIRSIRDGIDNTLELSAEELQTASKVTYSSDIQDLRCCNTYIVTVPTPIDKNNRPNLNPLLKASELIGRVIKQGDVVVYRSTVYPGATEEDCVPVIEKISGLKHNKEFFTGYSPERINPGDKDHRLPDIVKVTSGSTPDVASHIDALYRSIIEAGTHKASSITVAEASKVIENTQRDLNIALINEFAIILNKLNIDTESVLQAAETKWNFLPFRPGLVGGHCIGVDPYYLTHKAEQIGYHPHIILAGRRLNDGMGAYIASELIKKMLLKGINIHKSKVLVMGLSFKENCPDIRNTRVIDVIKELQDYSIEVDTFDPWVDPKVAQSEYGIHLKSDLVESSYDGIIVAVPHTEFVNQDVNEIRKLGRKVHVIFDVKSIYNIEDSDLRL